MSEPRGKFVCFASSFRLSGARGGVESPNIGHAVLDGAETTLCGRRRWETNEGDFGPGTYGPQDPDCLRCAARLSRLRSAP